MEVNDDRIIQLQGGNPSFFADYPDMVAFLLIIFVAMFVGKRDKLSLIV